MCLFNPYEITKNIYGSTASTLMVYKNIMNTFWWRFVFCRGRFCHIIAYYPFYTDMYKALQLTLLKCLSPSPCLSVLVFRVVQSSVSSVVFSQPLLVFLSFVLLVTILSVLLLVTVLSVLLLITVLSVFLLVTVLSVLPLVTVFSVLLLITVLSVFPWIAASEHPFGIFKLFMTAAVATWNISTIRTDSDYVFACQCWGYIVFYQDCPVVRLVQYKYYSHSFIRPILLYKNSLF